MSFSFFFVFFGEFIFSLFTLEFRSMGELINGKTINKSNTKEHNRREKIK